MPPQLEPNDDERIARARDALIADLLGSDGRDDDALRARLQAFADLFLEEGTAGTPARPTGSAAGP